MKPEQMYVSLIALGIVLEVLFSGQNVPFNISVIDNVQSIIAGFSAENFSWFSCCLNTILNLH